jgi:hypothetical protein
MTDRTPESVTRSVAVAVMFKLSVDGGAPAEAGRAQSSRKKMGRMIREKIIVSLVNSLRLRAQLAWF